MPSGKHRNYRMIRISRKDQRERWLRSAEKFFVVEMEIRSGIWWEITRPRPEKETREIFEELQAGHISPKNSGRHRI